MIPLQQIITPDFLSNFEFIDKLPPKFFVRLLIDLGMVTLLIRGIYYRNYQKSELFLTYFIFNFIIFLLTFLLNKVQMSMGAAFGLFAVFSMLRYRTEGISLPDMTYLFICISVGLLTAVSKGGWDELLFINGSILLIVFLLESRFFNPKSFAQRLHYERLDLIKPENRDELLNDLRLRLGINAYKIEIEEIDLLKDSARLIVHSKK